MVYKSNHLSELVFFFFSSRRRHTRCSRDWSSDVCSSDLESEAKARDEAEKVLNFFERTILAAARPQGRAGGLGHGTTVREAIDAAEPWIEIGRASCRERV